MAESPSSHKQNFRNPSELKAERRSAMSKLEQIQLYRRYLKYENYRLKVQHRNGLGGLEFAKKRADLLDHVLRQFFADAIESVDADPKPSRARKKSSHPVTLVAFGGFGRGTLNVGSDVDLLFLCPDDTTKLADDTEGMVEAILQMLWDVGFKVGHAVRSIRESVKVANGDHATKTAMLDMRFITGDQTLYDDFAERFHKDCIVGKEKEYLKTRRTEFKRRHEKYHKTVYVQEPNIKEGCGGLRDYQNIIWVLQVKFGKNDLSYLRDEKILSKSAYQAMTKAHEFLMRVRNELHYSERSITDNLTLRLQGVVATNLAYPQPKILRRIEAFMRDYYRHTRAIYMHSTSLMQTFRLAQKEEEPGLMSFLARRNSTQEDLGSFISRDGLIFPKDKNVFKDDPTQMMKVFLHTQQRHLQLSPSIRRLFKNCYNLIDWKFQRNRAVNDTFEAILGSKGEVARILRQMHRVGFLGKYLPEFGELDCLVQHEFFHRFTADEHTLKCIDVLDSLSDSSDPRTKFFQKLFHDLEDPAVLYIALIFHDAGRAENKRFHTDASTEMASDVCKRLNIRGERRKLLIFLVDNHLTFWKTATTKNIEDPDVIAEFAAVMGNRLYMEALLLMTFADSNGTNEEAWNQWKEMLMMQLYRSTRSYLEDKKAFALRIQDAKRELKEEVSKKLKKEYTDEINAIFELMPERYYLFREASDIVQHVKLFRWYIQHLYHADGPESLHPAINWIHYPDRGFTRLEIVCWDRKRLLMKVAGALAAKGINILSADIFTRSDNLVLDTFRVCTTDLKPVRSERIQSSVEALIKQMMDTTETVENVAKMIPPPDGAEDELVINFPTRVVINSESASANHTVMEVQALDRLGLLFDVFYAIGNLGVEIDHSRICTEKGAAIDTFYLTDQTGGRIVDPILLSALQRNVEKAIGI